MPYLITIALVAIVGWDLYDKTIELNFVHASFLLLAILPWAGKFIDTFKLSTDGIEATFKEKVERLESNVNALTDVQSEPDAAQAAAAPQAALSPEKVQVLKALTSSKYALRSFSGMLSETGIEPNPLNDLLEDLTDEGLIATAVGKRGNTLWTLRPEGRRALNDLG